MRLVNRGGNPDRKRALEFNQELRKDRRPFALPDQSGHLAFNMPAMDYWFWTAQIPELGSSDPDVARRAWLKFLNSENGKKYRVNPHEGKVGAPFTRGVIIR